MHLKGISPVGYRVKNGGMAAGILRASARMVLGILFLFLISTVFYFAH